MPFPLHPNMSDWYEGPYGQLVPAGSQWTQAENTQNQHDPFLIQATPPCPRPQHPPTPQLTSWVAQNYPSGVGGTYDHSVYGPSDTPYAITPRRDPYAVAPTPMRAPEIPHPSALARRQPMMGLTQTQMSSSSSVIPPNDGDVRWRDPLYLSNGPLLAARNPGPPPTIPSQVRHTAEPGPTGMTGQFRAWSASPRAQQTGGRREYRCNGDCGVPTCTQEFTRDYSLRRHIAEQASRNGGHPGYGCEICASRYLRLSDLSEHERKMHPALA